MSRMGLSPGVRMRKREKTGDGDDFCFTRYLVTLFKSRKCNPKFSAIMYQPENLSAKQIPELRSKTLRLCGTRAPSRGFSKSHLKMFNGPSSARSLQQPGALAMERWDSVSLEVRPATPKLGPPLPATLQSQDSTPGAQVEAGSQGTSHPPLWPRGQCVHTTSLLSGMVVQADCPGHGQGWQSSARPAKGLP